MEIAIGIPDYSCLFLSEADKKQRRTAFPPPPTCKLTHWSGGRGCNQGVGEQGRHLRKDGEQHWLYKPSRQEMAVSLIHCIA